MNLKADIALGAISGEVSRIEGLYTKFAQKNGTNYGVIQVLYALKFKNPITQKQISEICEIPKQTINSVIKQLQISNYIILETSSEDKREKKIRLTPLGESYSDELLKPFVEINEMVAKRVSMDLLHQLSKGIKTLGDALELEMEIREVSSKWHY